jgi:DNA adenine methylase
VLFVQQADWEETIERTEALSSKRGDVFYYFDPPFYQKAERLYRFRFLEADHTRLHDSLVKLKAPWLLSYDPATPIIEMYSSNGNSPRSIELLYSAATGSGLVRAQELIITNLPMLPDKTRLWSTSKEWRGERRFSATPLDLKIGGTARGDKYGSG